MMMNAKKVLAAAALAAAVFSSGISMAAGEATKATASAAPAGVTKEQVEAMALKEHPGKVEKAYKETKKGKEVWEVKIKGNDGKEYELYYDAQTGEPVTKK